MSMPPAGPTDPLAGLSAVTISPADASLTVMGGAAANTAFTATGLFADGHSADVTSLVTWSLANSTLGTINGGVVTANGSSGGITKVSASGDGVTGGAQLTIKYLNTEISTADGSTAPSNAQSLFAMATTADPTLAPKIVYPLDGVVMPSNLGELEVQWMPPTSSADLFEVAFLGDTIDFRVYTNTMKGRLALSPADWATISSAAAGTILTVQVTGLVSAAPTKSGVSNLAHVTMDAQPVNGGIYYWTPSNQGIERYAFGDTTSTATDFYSAPDADNHCVACHVLSHDGTKAMVTFDGGNHGSEMLDVASKMPLIPESQGLTLNFSSFSPDGNKIVAAHGTGTLAVYDTSGGATNGMAVGAIAPADGTWATHPDWSPDGKSLVFAQAPTNVVPPGQMSDWTIQEGAIVVMTGPGDGTFADPKMIVTSNDGNNYYPSFSPDGKWILFNRAASGTAYNNAAAELYVVSADGAIGPIALTSANGTGMLTNSWPRWSPFVQQYADGTTRMYLTFSSKRDYGIELVQPAAIDQQRPQLWMAAFDPAQAAASKDPSSAPFWLPFQDMTTSNHIAQWTTQIVQ
jgi:WD40 repeat protein